MVGFDNVGDRVVFNFIYKCIYLVFVNLYIIFVGIIGCVIFVKKYKILIEN